MARKRAMLMAESGGESPLLLPSPKRRRPEVTIVDGGMGRELRRQALLARLLTDVASSAVFNARRLRRSIGARC